MLSPVTPSPAQSALAAPASRPGFLRAFALTWVAYATYYLGRKGFSVSKKLIESQLHISMATLGVIDTVYLVGYAGGQFLCGSIGDRVGPRRLVSFGLFASAMACLAFGQGNTSAVLIIAWLVNGLTQSSGWPGTIKAMAAWTEGRADRGTVMGLWSTCYQVGGAVAGVFATWLLAWSWRHAFRVPALLMAAVAVVVFVFLRERPPSAISPVRDPVSRGSSPEPPPTGEELERVRQEQRRLYRNPLLWSYGACYFTLKLIRYSLLLWTPYFLTTAHNFSTTDAGYIANAFDIGGVLGSIVIGTLSDRFRRWPRAAWAALSVFCLALALLAYARIAPTSAAGHSALLATIGFLLFGPDSLISGAAAQDAGGPRAAATAAGIINGVGSLGAILQGAVTVGVSQRYGWDGLFFVFVALAVVGSLLLVPAIVRTRRTMAASARAGSTVTH